MFFASLFLDPPVPFNPCLYLVVLFFCLYLSSSSLSFCLSPLARTVSTCRSRQADKRNAIGKKRQLAFTGMCSPRANGHTTAVTITSTRNELVYAVHHPRYLFLLLLRKGKPPLALLVRAKVTANLCRTPLRYHVFVFVF